MGVELPVCLIWQSKLCVRKSDPIWGACAGKGAEHCAKLQCESHSGPMHKWAGVDTSKHPYACCIDESALDVEYGGRKRAAVDQVEPADSDDEEEGETLFQRFFGRW